MDIQFLSHEVLDCSLIITAPSLIRNILSRHHALLRNTCRNVGCRPSSLKIRQNFIQFLMFSIFVGILIPCENIAQLVFFGILCRFRLMSKKIQRISNGKVRDRDGIIFDSVNSIDVQVQCDIRFDGIDSRCLFLSEDFLGKSDAVKGSQVEETNYDLGMWNDREYCIGLDQSLPLQSPP